VPPLDLLLAFQLSFYTKYQWYSYLDSSSCLYLLLFCLSLYHIHSMLHKYIVNTKLGLTVPPSWKIILFNIWFKAKKSTQLRSIKVTERSKRISFFRAAKTTLAKHTRALLRVLLVMLQQENIQCYGARFTMRSKTQIFVSLPFSSFLHCNVVQLC